MAVKKYCHFTNALSKASVQFSQQPHERLNVINLPNETTDSWELLVLLIHKGQSNRDAWGFCPVLSSCSHHCVLTASRTLTASLAHKIALE